MKTLVVYYSLTGKTELVAKGAAEALEADIKKIEEVKPRGSGAKLYFTGGMDAFKDRCSEVRPIDLDLRDYDLVLVGSPNWAAKPVPAINAFVAQADFSGKDFVVFFTSGGDVKGNEPAIKNLTAKIEKRSGKVIGSFSIRSTRVTDAELTEQAWKAAAKYAPVGTK